nr:efflux RND transporter periplasmic adaptor subunit [Sphingosinithalassobacter tenebrarum]
MFAEDGQKALPGEEGRSSRRWWIIGGIVAVLALVAAVFLFSGGSDDGAAADKAAAQREGQIPTVTVAVPGRQAIQRVVSGTGSLAARREMPVGVVGEGGMVTRVLVEPGDWVRAGQVLARIDRSVQSQTVESLQAQVRVARADAEIAQSELDRAKQLVDRGFVSQADVERKTATRDSAVARVRVAEAQLAEARARNNRLDIRAPEAGLILTRNVEPGQVVSPGSGTLFRIAKGGQMELRAQLPEDDLQQLHAGVPAQVSPVGTDQVFEGEVWQVSPVIDPQTRQGIARISLSYDPALRPGGFASARIVAGSNEAPMLPQSAIQSDANGNYVYILNDQDEAVRRPIRAGEVSDEGVAIVDGLNGNERVVLSAGAFLNEGQKVKPELKTLR